MEDSKILEWMAQEGIIGHSKMSGYYYLSTKRNIPEREIEMVKAEGRSRYNAVEAIKAYMEENIFLPWGKPFINQQPYECYYDIEANNGKKFNFEMEEGSIGQFGGISNKFEVKQREGKYTLDYFKENLIMLNYHKVTNIKNLIIVYITADGYALFFDAENYDKLENRVTDNTTYNKDGSLDTSIRAFYDVRDSFFTYKLKNYGS